MAEGIQSSKAAQCLELPDTLPRGHDFVDSNLTSGTINGGRSTMINTRRAEELNIRIPEDVLKEVEIVE